MSTPPQFHPAPRPPSSWGGLPPHVPLPPPGVAAFAPAPRPRTSGLAVVAVVLSSLALLGVAGTALALAVVGLGGDPGDDGYGNWTPLTGQVAVQGGGLDGDDLAAAVRQELEDDGGDVQRITCPDTRAVGQNVTTVCHARVDESEWAMVVFFEDDRGTYTVLPV